jgi:hypothetical protein
LIIWFEKRNPQDCSFWPQTIGIVQTSGPGSFVAQLLRCNHLDVVELNGFARLRAGSKISLK